MATTKELKQVCAKIAQQTDDNDHTGAKITIAKFFLFRDFVKVFEAIETLHTIEGSLPEELSNYRLRKGKEMLQRVKDFFGEATYNAIYKSL